MKNEYKNIITSPGLRSILFLAILYFSQVYPFYHLHHFHDEGFLEFELSSPPIKVDIEHSSDHHHNSDTPQTDGHNHTFDKHIDWHITRTQNPRTKTSADQYLFVSLSLSFSINQKFSSVDNEEFIYIYNYHISPSFIRGPPLFG